MTSAVRTSSPGSDGDIFLICDRRALRRYGLGFVKPFPFPVGKHVKSGYLIRGESIADLAGKGGNRRREPGRDAGEIQRGSAAGIDREYGKGSTGTNRFQGDGAPRRQPVRGRDTQRAPSMRSGC